MDICGWSGGAVGGGCQEVLPDGALKPAEEVLDVELFPCPTLEEVESSPERLLTYILTRSHFHEEEQSAEWYIHEDL
jgi:hypothetical protein